MKQIIDYILQLVLYISRGKKLGPKNEMNAVKPVYNDHPWHPKIVAVVDRWSLLRGHLCGKSLK